MTLDGLAALMAVVQRPVAAQRWLVWGFVDQVPADATPARGLTLKQQRAAHAQLGLRLMRYLTHHEFPRDAVYELRWVVLHLREGNVPRLAQRTAASLPYLEACCQATAGMGPVEAEDMLRHVQACSMDLPLTAETRQFKVGLYRRLGDILEAQSKATEAASTQLMGLDMESLKALPLLSAWRQVPPAKIPQDLRLRLDEIQQRLEDAWTAWARNGSWAHLVAGHLQLCYRKLQMTRRPTAALAGRILDFCRTSYRTGQTDGVEVISLCSPLRRTDDWRVAVEVYRLSLQHRPNVAVRMLLAELLEERGEAAVALTELEGLERYRMEPVVHADLVCARARCLARIGRPFDALDAALAGMHSLADLYAEHPTHAAARLRHMLPLLNSLAWLGASEKSTRLLERIETLNPDLLQE
ncbi:MAG TPA: hypothetical protein VGO93_21450, partial [Candidatus Xenobia bacterium]